MPHPKGAQVSSLGKHICASCGDHRCALPAEAQVSSVWKYKCAPEYMLVQLGAYVSKVCKHMLVHLGAQI